jgi:hypothetical protein
MHEVRGGDHGAVIPSKAPQEQVPGLRILARMVALAPTDALSELVAACSRRGRTKECPILDSLEANGWFEHHKGGDNG